MVKQKRQNWAKIAACKCCSVTAQTKTQLFQPQGNRNFACVMVKASFFCLSPRHHAVQSFWKCSTCFGLCLLANETSDGTKQTQSHLFVVATQSNGSMVSVAKRCCGQASHQNGASHASMVTATKHVQWWSVIKSRTSACLLPTWMPQTNSRGLLMCL